MIKKKTNVSIDEWLEGGSPQLETIPVVTTVAEERPILVGGPAAEVVVTPLPDEPVVTVGADVAASGEEENSWFWELLVLSGYKRW